MAVIQIVAFILFVSGLSYVLRERIVDILPGAVSILILLLYGLALAGRLSWIDGINRGVTGAAAVFLISIKKDRRREILRCCKKELLHPGSIMFFVCVIVITVCVSGKVVTWWDDYNFWATDVKSLYALDGFAAKYCSVAPEFGDYPQGTQFIKWWFLHLDTNTFREGLMFAGYYSMNLAFLIPLFRRLPDRNPLMLGVSAVFLWIFPSVAESFYLSGTCADLTMAVVYGAFLAAVLDEEGHGKVFYYARLILYLMVLVLVKNVGFLWTAFALVFFFCYHMFIGKSKYSKKSVGKRLLTLVGVAVLPILTQVSWLVFCLLMRRVAKLTGTAVSMVTGNIVLPEMNREMIKAFFEAFFLWPLHKWKTVAVDLTPFALYLLICFAVYLLYRKKAAEKRKAVFLCIYFAVSGLIFYSMNLISHLTIFAIEDQYLQPYGMASSIERYGAPFMIGGLYVLMFLWVNREKALSWRPYVICFIFIFICADYRMAYEGLWGYRGQREEVMRSRDEIIGQEAGDFLKLLNSTREVAEAAERGGMRVLYIRDERDAQWVKNAYINFAASPVSVMYKGLRPEDATAEEVERAAKDTHAGYIYVEQLGEKAAEVFRGLTGDGTFSYAGLYAISYDGEQFKLIRVQ